MFSIVYLRLDIINKAWKNFVEEEIIEVNKNKEMVLMNCSILEKFGVLLRQSE
tara:strand:- start:389 stop:547 length:159 start_codon:yes stop_codon:yes gene_type:complete